MHEAADGPIGPAPWRDEVAQRYRAVFDTASVGVLELDREGRVVDANPVFRRCVPGIVGRQASAAMARVDALRAVPLWRDLIAGRRERYELAATLRRPDGTAVPGSVVVTAVVDTDGAVTGAIAVVEGPTAADLTGLFAAGPPETPAGPPEPARPPESPARPPETPVRPPESPAWPPESPARPPESPARPPETPAGPPEPARPPETPARPVRERPTPAEIAVLTGLASGLTLQQVAVRLGLTRRGVDYRLARLRQKLRADGPAGVPATTAGVVARGYTLGLLTPETWPPRAPDHALDHRFGAHRGHI